MIRSSVVSVFRAVLVALTVARTAGQERPLMCSSMSEPCLAQAVTIAPKQQRARRSIGCGARRELAPLGWRQPPTYSSAP